MTEAIAKIGRKIESDLDNLAIRIGIHVVLQQPAQHFLGLLQAALGAQSCGQVAAQRGFAGFEFQGVVQHGGGVITFRRGGGDVVLAL